MEIPQRFCVRWNSYKTNLQTAFPKLLTSEHFVDVTLACEKQYLKCHKIVLSACSVYFEDLLVNNPCQHPIIFMKDVAFWEMKALVEFMYKGEVNVSQEQLDSLLKSAESLQIRGLSGAKKWMEPEPEEQKKKKRRNGDGDDDGKMLQITSFDSKTDDDDCSDQEIKQTEDIKEEVLNDVDDAAYLENTDDDETGQYQADEIYNEPNRDPGPSNMSGVLSDSDQEIINNQDFSSLALNSVECVMDQERVKQEASNDAIGDNMAEHNYTNTGDGGLVTITRLSPTTTRQSTPVFRSILPKPSCGSNATVSTEMKPKVIKRDVFNRIRRSEAELGKAAEMVRGGMTFQTASDTFNIPISTIRFYMARRGILPQRRRGRGSTGVRDDDLIHPPFEIIHYRLPDIDKPL